MPPSHSSSFSGLVCAVAKSVATADTGQKMSPTGSPECPATNTSTANHQHGQLFTDIINESPPGHCESCSGLVCAAATAGTGQKLSPAGSPKCPATKSSISTTSSSLVSSVECLQVTAGSLQRLAVLLQLLILGRSCCQLGFQYALRQTPVSAQPPPC